MRAALKPIQFMISIFFEISLFILFIFLFFREVRLDHQRFLEADRLADEHILKEVEKFLNEQHGGENQNTVANEKSL